jgi:hypothetical protein
VALTPLTRVQQATVLALVEARRLDAVPADLARATSFLRRAGGPLRGEAGGGSGDREGRTGRADAVRRRLTRGLST